jgi:hypothetical protein
MDDASLHDLRAMAPVARITDAAVGQASSAEKCNEIEGAVHREKVCRQLREDAEASPSTAVRCGQSFDRQTY